MKPTPQLNNISKGRDFVDARRSARVPVIDCAFQANSFDDFSGRCRRGKSPSFRGISAGYFETEARKHFASEAILFVLIVATVAGPVFQAVRGLFQYVYGVL